MRQAQIECHPDAVVLSADGTIRFHDREADVRVSLASRYSLWIEFPDRFDIPTSRLCDSLSFSLHGCRIELGRSRLLDSDTTEVAFRLVPLSTLYDFDKLFNEGRIDQLDNSARSLPLLLGYKDNIAPDFQSLVADIVYDLSIYKDLFDGLDNEIRCDHDIVAETLQEGIIAELGPLLYECLDEHTSRLKHLDANLSARQKGHHGFYLRKQVWDSLMRAPFTQRTNLKPRGYIGDSEMMRMCYRHQHEGTSTFGKLLHYYPVSSSAATAVRNRRAIIPGLILNHADRLGATPERKLSVMSVACGPSTELVDVFRQPHEADRIRYALLDQDDLALHESAQLVAQIERNHKTVLDVRYFQDSVRTLLSTQTLKDKWGEFQVIYSMGLFDYLTAPVAELLLKKLYALLAPKGEMIIGNFHVSNDFRCFMDYWLDWPLIYRTEQQFLDLTRQLDNAAVSIDHDSTGVQMLMKITKKVD